MNTHIALTILCLAITPVSISEVNSFSFTEVEKNKQKNKTESSQNEYINPMYKYKLHSPDQDKDELINVDQIYMQTPTQWVKSN